jgi:hypothetical protein
MSKSSLTVVVLLALLLSCEEDIVRDCGECYPGGIETATLIISFRNTEYIPVNPTVTLYEGAVEDGIILAEYSIGDPYSYINYDALLYKDYTATLEFTLDGRRYITTAGACPQLGYDDTSCDEPCWFVFNNILDLRLRYQ